MSLVLQNRTMLIYSIYLGDLQNEKVMRGA
jgi:hypothetical protein